MSFNAVAQRLPPELVDHIIDHLYDDPDSLKSCARVCHAWSTPSQFHIFQKLSLKAASATSISPSELSKRLCSLLDTSPKLAAYVRELEVLDGAPGAPLGAQVIATAETTAADTAVWVATDTTLPRVLTTLPNLRHIELGTQSTSLSWSLLSSPLQHALQHVFSLASLTYLCLKSWSFACFADLTGLLACCKALQGLTLSSISVADNDEAGRQPDDDDDDGVNAPLLSSPPPSSTSRKCHLQFLTIEHIYCSPPLKDWLPHSSFDFSSLRELRVAHFEDLPLVQRLLAATGEALEHLHFKPGFGIKVYPFDLSLNPNLRSLKLTLEDPSSALSWAHSLLSSFSPSSTLLTHITLELYTSPSLIPPSAFASLSSMLLGHPSIMQSLKKMEIGLFTLTTSPEYVRVKEEMKEVQERGVLRMYRLGLKKKSEKGSVVGGRA